MCCKCEKALPDFLTAEQKNYAARELNDKLKFEAILDREIRPLFNKMNKAFRTKYAVSGSIIDFKAYKGELSAILTKAYERTQRGFKGSLNNGTKQADNDELLELGLIEWITQRLKTQPDVILETTQDDAVKAVRAAQEQLIEHDEPINAASVAVVAAVLNRRRLLSRVTGIAITETQGAAESTKYMEAQVASGRKPYTVIDDPFALTRPNEVEIKPATKQWITVGDKNVRASHVQANRQTVDIDDPYNVGGHDMRFPADMSLGAPIAEWINCRCSSLMNVKF